MAEKDRVADVGDLKKLKKDIESELEIQKNEILKAIKEAFDEYNKKKKKKYSDDKLKKWTEEYKDKKGHICPNCGEFIECEKED